MDEVRKLPLVCETVPPVEDPRPYTYNEATLCDDPDAWTRFLLQGFVQETVRPVQELLQDRPTPAEIVAFVCRDLLADRCQEIIKP